MTDGAAKGAVAVELLGTRDNVQEGVGVTFVNMPHRWLGGDYTDPSLSGAGSSRNDLGNPPRDCRGETVRNNEYLEGYVARIGRNRAPWVWAAFLRMHSVASSGGRDSALSAKPVHGVCTYEDGVGRSAVVAADAQTKQVETSSPSWDQKFP